MPFAMVSEPRICIPVSAFAASNAITLNAALVFGCGLFFARGSVLYFITAGDHDEIERFLKSL